MAVTSTTFLGRFPEFDNLESAVVTATIAEARTFMAGALQAVPAEIWAKLNVSMADVSCGFSWRPSIERSGTRRRGAVARPHT